MTRRERVIDALNFIETDFTPHNVFFTVKSLEQMNAHCSVENYAAGIGNHIVLLDFTMGVEETGRAGYFKDAFGVIWNRSGADKDIGVVDNLLLSDYEDLDALAFPAIDRPALRRKCEEFFETESGLFHMGDLGFSLFERAWTLRGMENLLVDMIENPAWVHKLMRRICDFNLEILDATLGHPFDGFLFGDDWGQQRGLIMGPVFWREFIKPYLREMYGAVKSKGIFVAQHSCGDIREIMDDLCDIGLNVYQTVQPEIYDLNELKRKYGGRLSFWGCISTQRDLAFKTPDEIRAITRDTIEIMGKGGGYIAAPTHDMPYDVPPENIIAMVEIFANQKRV